MLHFLMYTLRGNSDATFEGLGLGIDEMTNYCIVDFKKYQINELMN